MNKTEQYQEVSKSMNDLTKITEWFENNDITEIKNIDELKAVKDKVVKIKNSYNEWLKDEPLMAKLIKPVLAWFGTEFDDTVDAFVGFIDDRIDELTEEQKEEKTSNPYTSGFCRMENDLSEEPQEWIETHASTTEPDSQYPTSLSDVPMSKYEVWYMVDAKLDEFASTDRLLYYCNLIAQYMNEYHYHLDRVIDSEELSDIVCAVYDYTKFIMSKN
jgi:hypothetical protein